jgi:hypothetical protein
MFALIIFGLIAGIVISVVLLWLKKSGIQYPIFVFGIACLLVQAAYLLLILFDHAPDSEMWMFLALTYPPLSITFFIVLSILSVTKMLKEKTRVGRFKALAIIPVHGIGSYLILLAWSCIFQLPL